MALKFEIINNALVVTDTVTSAIVFDRPTKDTYYQSLRLDEGKVVLYDISGINSYASETLNKPLTDAVDSALTPFTAETFRTFARENLGKYNGGATSLKTGGFIDYNDSATSTTPITLVSDTWTEIPNDGLGAFTNKTYLPEGVTELMDTLTGYLDVTELSLGDSLLLRNDYSITPNTNNSLLRFRYSLGTGAGVYTLEKIVGRLDSGSGISYRNSLVTDLIYMGDLNTKDNPIKLEVNLSTNGTLVNSGSAIQVIKYYS